MILGSGPLFDIPVAQLAWRFDYVLLVDILHSWSVRRSVRRHRNVGLRSADVTGLVKDMYAIARSARALQAPERKLDLFLTDGFDLVVSANILSQLPLAPVRYASRRNVQMAPEQVAAFSRRLVVDHLDWLTSFAGNVCLISDLERHYCSDKGVVCREHSLWGVNLPEGGREWMWDLAPRPELEPDHDVRHRVVGYTSFPKQVWRRQRDGAKSK